MNIPPPPPRPKPAPNPPGGTLLYGPPPPRQNPSQEKRKRDERPEPSPPGRIVAEDPFLDDAWVYAGQIVVMLACLGGILLDAALLYAKWAGRF